MTLGALVILAILSPARASATPSSRNTGVLLDAATHLAIATALCEGAEVHAREPGALACACPSYTEFHGEAGDELVIEARAYRGAFTAADRDELVVPVRDCEPAARDAMRTIRLALEPPVVRRSR